MEVLSVVGAVLIAGAVIYLILFTLPRLQWKMQVDPVARQLCPRCSAPIGIQEAEAAFERAAQFARAHVHARVGPGAYSSLPIVCPSCHAKATFWRTTHEIRLVDSADAEAPDSYSLTTTDEEPHE